VKQASQHRFNFDCCYFAKWLAATDDGRRVQVLYQESGALRQVFSIARLKAPGNFGR
jgi:hypothetical protein